MEEAASSAAGAAAVATAAPTVTYERELDASVERIWENVLDWEHLPHLHAQAFSSIAVTASGRGGWHGEVGLPSGGTAEIDVALDRPALRYVTSTVAGAGAGTAIVTQMFPRTDRRTGIRVEFFLPWARPGAEEAIGSFYRDLYVVLWDQDEAMMRERQRVLDAGVAAPAPGEGVSLGSMRQLAPRLPLDVELGGRRLRVVAIDGQLHAFDTRCPHLGGPLGARPLEGCEAVCPWHGYRFDVRTGASSDGRGLRLGRGASVQVSACDGEVRLVLR